uniref:Uncharacterized protein n=1 Tax=Rhizophora mucronata TaxID=61149 RepID=A0A2P2LZU0_RHIMU
MSNHAPSSSATAGNGSADSAAPRRNTKRPKCDLLFFTSSHPFPYFFSFGFFFFFCFAISSQIYKYTRAILYIIMCPICKI